MPFAALSVPHAGVHDLKERHDLTENEIDRSPEICDYSSFTLSNSVFVSNSLFLCFLIFIVDTRVSVPTL